MGAIVGGVVGGVAGLIAILLVCLFFVRRRRFHQHTKERPVDLTDDADGDDGNAQVPHYYAPEPFLVPDPTLAGTTTDGGRSSTDGTSRYGYGVGAGAGTGAAAAGRAASSRPSSFTETDPLRPGTPGTSSFGGTDGGGRMMRKSPLPPSMRPVNIIQHDDAGPSVPGEEGAGESETIELPPAYTNIRK